MNTGLNHEIRLSAQKFAKRLELIAPLVYRRRQALEPLRLRVLSGPLDDPLAQSLEASNWPVLPPHSSWGAQDVTFLLVGHFRVPADFALQRPVALYLPLGDAGEFSHPEALAYLDRAPYAAVDRHHQEILLDARFRDGRGHELLLHGWTGNLGSLAPDAGRHLVMGECAVVEIDPPTRAFIALARTALEAANLLDPLQPARTSLYNALDAAFRLLDTREPWGEPFYASVPAALDALRSGIAAAGPPLDVDLVAAGHAHIDVAWLWTLGQTRRKAGRTFHTVVRLMEQFADYHFTQSQPQLYDFVRHDYPALFEAIRARVVEGRWEPIGGMWIEADCNLSGPESLVRQFLLGRAFFAEHFGPDAASPVLWLPDVFGYCANLPQLIKLAGLDYFFTIKIGWNQYNAMPFDSFWWQGLDGTRVLTHFSTAPERPGSRPPEASDWQMKATYNADLAAFSVLGAWARLKHKESQRLLLMSYGYGDGGGGPTREMNENAQALRAFPGLPRVSQGKVIDFFRRLEAESGDQLPVWNGELYLELHRGTYTTQSRNKRANRRSEFLLHDAEFVATLARLLDRGYTYPYADLHRAWELVCLNQFHDIIPGSSIGAVYEESLRQYAEVRALGEGVRASALDVIAAAAGGDIVLVNPSGFARDDLALWPAALPAGRRPAGQVTTQAVAGGTLIAGATISAYGVVSLSLVGEGGSRADETFFLSASPTHLENAFVRVELDARGDISRIFDKQAMREVLPPGRVANQFQAFEDRPLNWDAWDVDIFYEDALFLAEPATACEVEEEGPLRACVAFQRQILHSPYTQRISLDYNSPLITIRTTIDWRERHILLKAAFPVDVLAPSATYEVQWGSVERPTHRNTSWDWARFETCAQKWVDLREGGYAVALLNDCKYGHDIHDNVLRITLLRSPTEPDPNADQGEQQFAYALYPRAAGAGDDLSNAGVARRAYLFNDPLLALSGSGKPATPLPGFVDAPSNLIVETVKAAEDGQGVIVRLYECNRQRGPATLRFGFALAQAWRCNLLEENQEALVVEGSQVNLFVRPFEITTLRLLPV